MPKRDLDKAASRFLNALRRVTAGLVTQRQRVMDRADNAPRLLPGTELEVLDLTGDGDNDLDYYVYELGRLQAVGRSVVKVFGGPAELVAARDEFERAIPHLKGIRDPLTHPNDNDELDSVAWFSSVVRLRGDGGVDYLVDPRYQHHDAAVAYSGALTSYLRRHVAQRMAADPAPSVSEQIERRRAQLPPT